MSQFAWLTPVLIAAIIVFVVDLVGNYLELNNRVLNALLQAILFVVVFGLLTAYFTPTEVTITPVSP
jgi:predicted PurR-regulated permease PerM